MGSLNRFPRVVFFDVGDTLVRPRRPYGELLRDCAVNMGVHLPEAAVIGLAAHINNRVMTRTTQGLPFTFPPETSQRFWSDTYTEHLRQFLPAPDVRRLTGVFLELLSSPDGYVLYPDTVGALHCLRSAGYRLSVISNWEVWLPSLLSAVGIGYVFDDVVASGACGYEKPDPQIFTHAVQRGGYLPSEAVYVGDRPAHDVVPALSVGITPILLDRDARYPRDDRVITIGSLSDLASVLDGMQDQSARATAFTGTARIGGSR